MGQWTTVIVICLAACLAGAGAAAAQRWSLRDPRRLWWSILWIVAVSLLVAGTLIAGAAVLDLHELFSLNWNDNQSVRESVMNAAMISLGLTAAMTLSVALWDRLMHHGLLDAGRALALLIAPALLSLLLIGLVPQPRATIDPATHLPMTQSLAPMSIPLLIALVVLLSLNAAAWGAIFAQPAQRMGIAALVAIVPTLVSLPACFFLLGAAMKALHLSGPPLKSLLAFDPAAQVSLIDLFLRWSWLYLAAMLLIGGAVTAALRLLPDVGPPMESLADQPLLATIFGKRRPSASRSSRPIPLDPPSPAPLPGAPRVRQRVPISTRLDQPVVARSSAPLTPLPPMPVTPPPPAPAAPRPPQPVSRPSQPKTPGRPEVRMPRVFMGVVGFIWFTIAWLTVVPFNLAPKPVSAWLANFEFHPIDVATNIAAYIPAGFATFWLLRTRGRSVFTSIFLAVLIGSLVSLSGETAQVWLPGRVSALSDLMNNTIGALAGALLAIDLVPVATDLWNMAAQRVETRRRLRILIYVGIAWFLITMVPFDISIDPRYLYYTARDLEIEGLPFKHTMAWFSSTESSDLLWSKMAWEVWGAVLNVTLMAVVTVAVGRAAWERARIVGRSIPPVIVAFFSCLLLPAVGEFMKRFVHHRNLHLSDAIAGLAGVLAGCVWLVTVRPEFYEPRPSGSGKL